MKVDYHPDFPLINPTVFGSKFVARVANPRHMLLNQKKQAIRVVILVKIKGVFARIEVNTVVGKLCHQLITQ